MRGLRTLTITALVLASAACSGDDEPGASVEVPTSTAGSESSSAESSATESSATESSGTNLPVGDATEPVFPSLSGFIAAYTAIGPAATPGSEAFPLTLDGLVRGPLATGEEGWVDVASIPNAIIGGTLDADEGVNAVFVFVDPASTAAGTAVISLVGATIASNAEFDQPAFVQAYGELAADAATSVGEQRWQPSANGSGHSLVTSIVEGAGGTGNLIEVAIVPIADEAGAKAAVKPLRNAVIGLAAG